jgi:hypothetical protein
MGSGHQPRTATNRGTGHLSRVVALDVAEVDRSSGEDALTGNRHHLIDGDNSLIYLGERRVYR